jgi:hypothetical protein
MKYNIDDLLRPIQANEIKETRLDFTIRPELYNRFNLKKYNLLYDEHVNGGRTSDGRFRIGDQVEFLEGTNIIVNFITHLIHDKISDTFGPLGPVSNHGDYIPDLLKHRKLVALDGSPNPYVVVYDQQIVCLTHYSVLGQ